MPDSRDKAKRRRWQFTLATLLMVMTFVAVALSPPGTLLLIILGIGLVTVTFAGFVVILLDKVFNSEPRK